MTSRPTTPVPAPLTVPAPPSAELLVDSMRPDLRLPSDAVALAALAVVRDAIGRDSVELEVSAMFADLNGDAEWAAEYRRLAAALAR